MCALRPDAHAAAAGLVGVADAAGGRGSSPPVGKSGPLMCCIRPATSIVRVVDVGDRRGDRPRAGCAAGCSSPCRRRCRDEPLTSRFGKRAGSTSGSLLASRRSWARSRPCRRRGRAASRVAMRRQARLRVAHGGGRVVVDRAEVALAVDERVAHREVLRHAHERVVDRASRRAGGTCPSPRRRCCAHFDVRRGSGCRPSSFIAYSTRRWTGFRPSRTSGSARPTMTDIA